MGYHQGVQKQNCLKWVFIRKQSGAFTQKLRGLEEKEVAYHSSRNKIVSELECPIILILSVQIIGGMFG